MTKAQRKIIAQYIDRIDAIDYRISRDGELHIKGVMPNTSHVGWYFAGPAERLLTEIADGNR